jgi:hypothetical protein
MKWMAVLALAVAAVGCKGKAKTPAVAPLPRAAAEPVSVPQTTVRLPPEQPVPPGATPPPREPPSAPPAVAPVTPAPQPKPVTRTRPSAPPPSRPAPAEPPAQPPPAAAPPALRPVLTPEQERDLRDRIERSMTAARQSLSRARAADRQAAERVKAFLEQARQARDQGDLVRARSLAERAEWLAADLARTTTP